jgi:hypothetical protein
LTVLALAATCSLPAAAQAAELPSVQPAAAGVAAQLGQTATAAGAAALDTTAPAQAAVQQTAAEVVAPARPAVEHAAETVTKTAAAQRPAVDTAVRTVETAVAPTQPVAPAPPAAKRAGDGVRALHSAPSEGTVQKARRHRNTGGETAKPSGREPVPSVERAHVSRSTPSAPSDTAGSKSADGSASATFDLVAGAGSTASASSTAFSIGAVGLLAAALMLGAPAAARRLRADGASLRPVLFASVLERPG